MKNYNFDNIVDTGEKIYFYDIHLFIEIFLRMLLKLKLTELYKEISTNVFVT